MKNILSGAVAAIALAAISAPAAAQTHQQTNQRHYSTPTLNLPVFGTIGGEFENPSTAPIFGIFPSPQEIADAAVEGTIITPSVGTRYTAETTSHGNSDTASPTVNVNFRLKGTVNKDCSFYSGNNASARSIDFGVIGIKTGNNENVSNAFEMVGPATANIETLTAGCNFNNEVVITKDNAGGLVNDNPGGYDVNEFQANIPYKVDASWTGVAFNTVAGGSPQTLSVTDSQTTNTKQQGAWRSDMQIDIVAPRINGKGLVAGQYKGTTTLTLRAL